MAFVKIWVHAVWGTKDRAPILTPSIHDQTCRHIKENAASKDIYIDSINGHLDHLHCLMLLNVQLSISKQMQLIKGESSNWVNKKRLIKRHFEWADEYYAASVSESNLDRVRFYIHNQQEHHKKKTFLDECETFLKQFHLIKG